MTATEAITKNRIGRFVGPLLELEGPDLDPSSEASGHPGTRPLSEAPRSRRDPTDLGDVAARSGRSGPSDVRASPRAPTPPAGGRRARPLADEDALSHLLQREVGIDGPGLRRPGRPRDGPPPSCSFPAESIIDWYSTFRSSRRSSPAGSPRGTRADVDAPRHPVPRGRWPPAASGLPSAAARRPEVLLAPGRRDRLVGGHGVPGVARILQRGHGQHEPRRHRHGTCDRAGTVPIFSGSSCTPGWPPVGSPRGGVSDGCPSRRLGSPAPPA